MASLAEPEPLGAGRGTSSLVSWLCPHVLWVLCRAGLGYRSRVGGGTGWGAVGAGAARGDPSFLPPRSVIMTGSYNNFFRMFDRNTKRDVTLEASRENSKPRAILKPRKVCVGGKRRKDEISVDSLDFSKKILHTAWHPSENIIAVAATNNLYIFQDKVN